MNTEVPAEISADKIDIEIEKMRLDYAWKWFAFHAEQRTKMFNFFILAIGILATAVFSWYHQREIAIVLCVVGVVVALIFSRLDRRNRDLVWLGEEMLIDMERRRLYGESKTFKDRNDFERPYGILWRQRREETQRNYLAGLIHDAWIGKHRIWLRGIAYLTALIFAIAGVGIFLLSD
jgi:hypothetical protein